MLGPQRLKACLKVIFCISNRPEGRCGERGSPAGGRQGAASCRSLAGGYEIDPGRSVEAAGSPCLPLSLHGARANLSAARASCLLPPPCMAFDWRPHHTPSPSPSPAPQEMSDEQSAQSSHQQRVRRRKRLAKVRALETARLRVLRTSQACDNCHKAKRRVRPP